MMHTKETKETKEAQRQSDARASALDKATERAQAPLTAFFNEIDVMWSEIGDIMNKSEPEPEGGKGKGEGETFTTSLKEYIESFRSYLTDYALKRNVAEEELQAYVIEECTEFDRLRTGVTHLVEDYKKYANEAGQDDVTLANTYTEELPLIAAERRAQVDADFVFGAKIWAHEYARQHLNESYDTQDDEEVNPKGVIAENGRIEKCRNDLVRLKSESLKDSAERTRKYVTDIVDANERLTSGLMRAKMHFITEHTKGHFGELDEYIDITAHGMVSLAKASADVAVATKRLHDMANDEYANAVTALMYAKLLELNQVSSAGVKRMREECE